MHVPTFLLATVIFAVGVPTQCLAALLLLRLGPDRWQADGPVTLIFGGSLISMCAWLALTGELGIRLMMHSDWWVWPQALLPAGLAAASLLVPISVVTIPRTSSATVRLVIRQTARRSAHGLPIDERADYTEITQALLSRLSRRERFWYIAGTLISSPLMVARRRRARARLDRATRIAHS